MYTVALASLLLTGFTAAAPLAQAQAQASASGTVTLQIGISTSGDDSTTRTIPFGTLFANTAGALPPASSLSVSSVSNVPIDPFSSVCQAFTDAAGKIKLGGTFDDSIPGITVSKGNNLATIGSVFCSDAAGVAAFSSGSGNGNGKGTGYGNGKGVSAVNIKLDFDLAEEGASVGTVPVNGQLVPVRGTFATRVANKAAIQSGNNGQQPDGVTCQAFSDEAGTLSLGAVKGNGAETVFGQNGADVPIGAFKCVNA
ncbi:uncharacterized protein KY384_002055 [Bacidia gigantensis]|uniref:uncharacterized protein n=1 Tax=Bacidia gigantensis TaxID=2732470 RepID=UPI001D04774D|nr:uncharacterized protein KY384_002055 [Bacidia gigantensis]KAG8533272.1 hypothetical protein KY384_002055 [Bacidia gigantensis]